MKKICIYIAFILLLTSGPAFCQAQILKQPIPDHLVVLTFDDAASSHAEFVAPLLKKYGFDATFFVCEFPPDFSNKHKYMTWEQIKKLHEMGFEVGNHTRDHTHVDEMSDQKFRDELSYIENKAAKYGIPKPVSFAYPAWKTEPAAINILKQKGYLFARAGEGRPYDPTRDHPYLIPSYNAAGTDTAKVIDAVRKAKNGKIVVLTFHGVPDYAHDWVTTSPDLFKYYLNYLKQHEYTVISVEDLSQYINPEKTRNKIDPHFK